MRITGRLSAALLVVGAHVAMAGVAMAGGFTIEDHSAAQLGVANAGAAAAAADATTIYDNPAGIALLNQPQLVATLIPVYSDLAFTNSGSRLPTGAPLNGPNDNGGGFAPLPYFFLSAPATSELSLGLGVFPSFGLATNYAANWVGRYSALATKLTSFDIAPTVAYRALPGVSVGFSPIARYSKARFVNAVDFGTIGAAFGIPGAAPGAADGSSDVRADGWSFAFNGGVLLEPSNTTRLGLSYFYNGAATVKGSVRFARSAIGDAISAASGAFVSGGASSVIAYPDHLTFGIVQSLSPDLDIRGGVTWTRWSSFREVRINFANPVQSPSINNESWRDAGSFSLGSTYRIAPEWLLRAGIEYDQTPIPNQFHRDPRIPDASRIETAVGLGYRLTDSTDLDFAYEHLFGKTVKINSTSGTGDQLIGRSKFAVDVFALQLTVRY